MAPPENAYELSGLVRIVNALSSLPIERHALEQVRELPYSRAAALLQLHQDCFAIPRGGLWFSDSEVSQAVNRVFRIDIFAGSIRRTASRPIDEDRRDFDVHTDRSPARCPNRDALRERELIPSYPASMP